MVVRCRSLNQIAAWDRRGQINLLKAYEVHIKDRTEGLSLRLLGMLAYG